MANKNLPPILTTEAEIKVWFSRYAPGNQYKIFKNNYADTKDIYPFMVDVRESIQSIRQKMEVFPFQFNHIQGMFDCGYNFLTNLVGAPRTTEGNFHCMHNRLTSLLGAPEEVMGGFVCSYNELTNLEHSPKKVFGIYGCSNNSLISLSGVTKHISSAFDCRDNLLTDLALGPDVVERNYYAERNPLKSFYPCNTKLGQGLYISRSHNIDMIGMESFEYDEEHNSYSIFEEERKVAQEKLFILQKLNHQNNPENVLTGVADLTSKNRLLKI